MEETAVERRKNIMMIFTLKWHTRKATRPSAGRKIRYVLLRAIWFKNLSVTIPIPDSQNPDTFKMAAAKRTLIYFIRHYNNGHIMSLSGTFKKKLCPVNTTNLPILEYN